MSENPKKWEGRKILFIHTGGLLGLYDKVDQMASIVGNWHRLDVHESVPRKDATLKILAPAQPQTRKRLPPNGKGHLKKAQFLQSRKRLLKPS
ncbi:hypothetical protein TIFTF001_056167 [Ficus carica]|uniref:Uncharacterized protein n=1 Tax=Ficus carica TaxID=3494 RepID=A0AA88EG71_FICCA|nr:hypothetical protein TIFTF001_056167 [Ficus carica]